MAVLNEPLALKYVGKSVTRREGADKLTGRARYVDDLVTPGALHARTLRSSIPAGRIKSITFSPEIDWREYVVVTAKDLPHNVVALIEDDQPAFADEIVMHREEAILLVAHEDHGLATEALSHIHVEYEQQQPALAIGEGEVMKRIALAHGDAAAEFARPDVVIHEGTYETGAQEHVYIEPNGFIAWWEGDTVVLHGSHQCPYYVHKAVKKAFGFENDDQVRVIQETTGGGFGGKEDFPSTVAIHAALVSRKAGGRPVRLMYDRAEDLACSTKRHPSRSRVRTAVTREGEFRALEMKFEIDGGAYVTLSPVVLSRGVVHCFGPYRWEATDLVGNCWRTNSVPYGAFRGFGAPQSEFAIEMHINRVAEDLGISPVEIRRKNFLRKGDMIPTEQVLTEEPPLPEILDRALQLSGFEEKHARYKEGEGRGIALSASFHGTGFTGSGETFLKSVVAIEAHPGGEIEILVASTEIGQGTVTVFTQIAAEALDVPIEIVRFRKPETGAVPNSGPTVASRTCSIVGGLVERAARRLRKQIGDRTVEEATAAEGTIRAEAEYEEPPGLVWNDDTYKGCAYDAYSWCVNVAEVSVDAVTMAPQVETLWGIFDIGRVINPVLALGQVEGGMAQAAGWATCEDVVLHEGIMKNNRMTNYIIPTTADIPEMVADFVERPYERGAFGAKGVGELPMDGPASAIATAAGFAAGHRVSHIPVRPEDLLK